MDVTVVELVGEQMESVLEALAGVGEAISRVELMFWIWGFTWFVLYVWRWRHD